MENEIEIYRREFNIALNAAVERALMFEQADIYMDELFSLILKANFHVWSDESYVASFFEMMEQRVNGQIAAVLDFLHEFNALFAGALSLHTHLAAVPEAVLATVYGANSYTANGTPALYDQAHERNPTPATITKFVAGNPWLRAILWIRFLGMDRLIQAAARSADGKKAS